MAYKEKRPIPITEGGTNTTTLAVDGTLYYDGASVVGTSTGTSGWVLTSNGAGFAPTYQAASSGGITIIDGNSGAVTGSTVTIETANSTVQFVNSGSTSTMDFGVAGNLILGSSNNNGNYNVGVGHNAFSSNSSATLNTLIGYNSMPSLSSGTENVAVGYNTYTGTSGSNNTCLGTNSGQNYTGAESNNILINNDGTVGESAVTRIGTPGTQTTAYVAGIYGNTPSNSPQMVIVDSTNGQLGSQAVPGIITTTFNSSNTWTANALTKYVKVYGWFGGGGGGSGAHGATSSAVGGGGGGAAGPFFMFEGPISFFGSSATVTVGAGGAGGTAVSSPNNGNSGALGGQTLFGSISIATSNQIAATGGTSSAGGSGGTVTISGFANFTPSVTSGSTNGGAGAITGGLTPTTMIGGYLFATGGGGGSGSNATITYTGGYGGTIESPDGTISIVAGGTPGAAAVTVAGNGNNAPTSGGIVCGGSGGGGAGGSHTGVGATNPGGNGGIPGGGGGGGGGNNFLSNSGAIGGNGGAGQVIVIEFL